jgi:hypothetical protein
MLCLWIYTITVPERSTKDPILNSLCTGTKLIEVNSFGKLNPKWQKRSDLLDDVPPEIMCATENQNGEQFLYYGEFNLF